MSLTEKNRQIIQAFFDGFARGDLSVVDQYFTEDIDYLVVNEDAPNTKAAIPWIGRYRGIDGVKQFLGHLAANIQVLQIEAHDMIVNGDDGAVFGQFKYKAKSTGNLMKVRFAIRIKMRAGKISHYHFYEDTFAVAYAYRQSGHWQIAIDNEERNLPE